MSDDAPVPRKPARPRKARIAEKMPSRTEKVHEALRQAIIEQRLAPGARLPEDTIGESFGTSRTIAREALLRLSVEGLVDLLPNRGAFVANPSLDEGRDVFVVRRGLERMVVKQLAGQLSASQIEELGRMLEQEELAGASNESEAIRLAGEFHLRLAEMTGNRLLIRYLTETVSRCSLVLTIYGRPHSVDCGIDEHRQIIEALIAGDENRAADLMETHLSKVAGRALLECRKTESLQDVLTAFARRID
ncbi:GntR family transcriptional regulator [Gemmobacter serpentinus]|uniref:GntR family transcriptional regulator n=1 Tax=Gemmobacter serpentinus TaxID=2652247 RepID=UPI001CF6AC01|nr:GntR family transcriptional regulator [Gemmobacter serpentinus]